MAGLSAVISKVPSSDVTQLTSKNNSNSSWCSSLRCCRCRSESEASEDSTSSLEGKKVAVKPSSFQTTLTQLAQAKLKTVEQGQELVKNIFNKIVNQLRAIASSNSIFTPGVSEETPLLSASLGGSECETPEEPPASSPKNIFTKISSDSQTSISKKDHKILSKIKKLWNKFKKKLDKMMRKLQRKNCWAQMLVVVLSNLAFICHRSFQIMTCRYRSPQPPAPYEGE